VGRLARHLADQGRRVGLITNDQGSGLVDTALLSSRGFAVEEIPGGCFCCRFSSLVEAARKLTAATRPDVFIAEPVGSCTDLVATVSYPLRRIYGDAFSVAPLSVLVDPVRARRVLGLAEGPKFSEKVVYIYLKQLEEADVLVINKRDLLTPAELDALRAELARRFPRADLCDLSARQGQGLEGWFERLERGRPRDGAAMGVDYEVYAEGEALLGWLNATIRLSAKAAFDGNALLRSLAGTLQARLASAGAEVAHLKMTLDPGDGLGGLAVVNLVRNDHVPELSQELEEPVGQAELILNLRAEAPPEVLREAVTAALAGVEAPIRAETEHLEFFQPGKPRPEHRIESL
jgi:Ni2+-binding GTPase involved in maturation of urease and hydrogenase